MRERRERENRERGVKMGIWIRVFDSNLWSSDLSFFPGGKIDPRKKKKVLLN